MRVEGRKYRDKDLKKLFRDNTYSQIPRKVTTSFGMSWIERIEESISLFLPSHLSACSDERVT